MQYLSQAEFLEYIYAYVSNLSQEDCCVPVQGKDIKCKCIRFLAGKSGIVKLVALGLNTYFDLEESNRKLLSVNHQRQATRLIRRYNSPWRHRLRIFIDQFTINNVYYFDKYLHEAMELSMCHFAWARIYNLAPVVSQNNASCHQLGSEYQYPIIQLVW